MTVFDMESIMKKIVFATTALLSQVAVFAADDPVVTVADDGAVPCECAFDSAYLGLGIGGKFFEAKADALGKSAKSKANLPVGTVFFGAGKTFKKFYIGPEFLFDFTKNKTKKDYIEGEEFEFNQKGIMPQLGLRIGGIVRNDWLIYLRIAGAYNKTSVKHSSGELSCSKVTPTLALGVEKLFCRKFSARLEGEYVFKSSKDKDYTLKKKTEKVKLKNEGWNFRALCAYNIKY